jgi:hypothetical protein
MFGQVIPEHVTRVKCSNYVIVGSDPRSLAVGEKTRKQVKRFAEPKMCSPHDLHHNHNLKLYKIDKYKS